MVVQAEPVEEGGVAAELVVNPSEAGAVAVEVVVNPDDAGGVAVAELSVKPEVKGEGGVA